MLAIQASFPTDDTATVDYDGLTLSMTIAVSGSGARYVGDELEWWTKGTGLGSEGTLFRLNSDGPPFFVPVAGTVGIGCALAEVARSSW